MAKIKLVEHIYNGEKYHIDQYHYWCLGCGYEHAFSLKSVGGHHTFNGDLNNPTVSPSLLQNFGGDSRLCHSFIRDGKIQYLGDCQHNLAGKTVELPDVDEMIDKRKEEYRKRKEENSNKDGM